MAELPGNKKLKIAIIYSHGLDEDEPDVDGFVNSTSSAILKVLPPVSRFKPTEGRTKKRENGLEKLIAFFNKF